MRLEFIYTIFIFSLFLLLEKSEGVGFLIKNQKKMKVFLTDYERTFLINSIEQSLDFADNEGLSEADVEGLESLLDKLKKPQKHYIQDVLNRFNMILDKENHIVDSELNIMKTEYSFTHKFSNVEEGIKSIILELRVDFPNVIVYEVEDKIVIII